MKFKLLPAAIFMAAGWVAAPPQAAGCLKGAAVSEVAGHYAGHHGVLGAGAGCVIGHHARPSTSGKGPATGLEQRQPGQLNSGH